MEAHSNNRFDPEKERRAKLEARATIAKDDQATTEKVIEAFEMTVNEQHDQWEAEDYDYNKFRIYESLYYNPMKDALLDASTTRACRDSIITALFRQPLREAYESEFASFAECLAIHGLSDQGLAEGWSQASSEEKDQFYEDMSFHPGLKFEELPRYAARRFQPSTSEYVAAKPSAEGQAIMAVSAARNLAVHLHEDVTDQSYAVLSDVPKQILSESPLGTADLIKASWSSIHQAYRPGLDVATKDSILSSECISRLEKIRDWPEYVKQFGTEDFLSLNISGLTLDGEFSEDAMEQ